MKNNLIGIDLGGTKLEIVILDVNKEIQFRERLPTESEKGPSHIINQILVLYKKALSFINRGPHTIGVGSPGSLSPKTKLLRNSNTLCLNGLPLQKLIEEALQKEIILENDANCFALAEANMGAGQNHDLVFGVIMGTGCGGGFIINNNLRVGPQQIAGEWGHSVINSNGPPSYCGNNGCVETYISGGGLENILKSHGILSLTAKDFLNKKQHTNDEKFILKNFYSNFGIALANIINIIDPDIVILGGGLSNHDRLYDIGIQETYNRVFHESPSTPIVKNKLGDSAGVIGAALIGDI